MLVIQFQSHTVLTLQDVSFIWYCLGSVSSVLTLQDVSLIWCCLGSVSTVFTVSTVITVFTVLDLARHIFHLILSVVCIHCFGPYQLYLSFGTFWGLCLHLLDWTGRVVSSILSWSLWFLALVSSPHYWGICYSLMSFAFLNNQIQYFDNDSNLGKMTFYHITLTSLGRRLLY